MQRQRQRPCPLLEPAEGCKLGGGGAEEPRILVKNTFLEFVSTTSVEGTTTAPAALREPGTIKASLAALAAQPSKAQCVCTDAAAAATADHASVASDTTEAEADAEAEADVDAETLLLTPAASAGSAASSYAVSPRALLWPPTPGTPQVPQPQAPQAQPQASRVCLSLVELTAETRTPEAALPHVWAEQASSWDEGMQWLYWQQVHAHGDSAPRIQSAGYYMVEAGPASMPPSMEPPRFAPPMEPSPPVLPPGETPYLCPPCHHAY